MATSHHCVILTLPDSLPVTDLRDPWGSKFFQFHAVFGKIWQNLMLAPPSPGQLAPPPRGNPGSATVYPFHSRNVLQVTNSNMCILHSDIVM